MRPGEDAPSGLGAITDAEFHLLQKWIHEHVGIFLPATRRALLIGRLRRRVEALGLGTYSAYLRRVSLDPREQLELIDRVCTNETSFFREPDHFELLRRSLVPRWLLEASQGKRASAVRVWSAACSSGEEPYSLAMLLMEHLPAARGWSVQVHGTDVSTRALAHAQRGIYRAELARSIPQVLLHKYLLRGVRSQAEQVKVCAQLRQRVQFARLNLHEPARHPAGPFDVIFCRNALIYFGREARAAVVARLVSQLSPDGVLFVGHAESLAGVPDVACVMPTVYRRAGGAADREGGRLSRSVFAELRPRARSG